MTASVVRANTYRDSIFLMKLSVLAAKESGAETISAMMATDRNKELFSTSGLLTPEIAAAKPNDLAIAIKAEGEAAERAVAAVLRLLDEAPVQSGAGAGAAVRPKSIRQAVQAAPAGEVPNLALISVAGDYARLEAATALAAGMDVMLYSDNISIRDELALKKMARARKLLVMGPDCGTALVGGVPLAFANRVAKGPVGVIGASGTGLQEVLCLLDRMGVGITQAYGTGGRDLKDEIGGLCAFTALERLVDDPETKALVVLGKPPGEKTRANLLARLRQAGKPVFVHYIGASDYAAEREAGLTPAADLTELAVLAARHFRPEAKLDGADDQPKFPAGSQPGYLCGVFGGGTLCQEAAEIAGRNLPGPKASNLKVAGFQTVHGNDSFAGHVFWDLGEDEFTVGRPHPMMAPDLKMERVVAALTNPAVAVVLMDMVIGYGAHGDQAALALAALARAAGISKGASRRKIVVASVCGTDADRPSRRDEVEKLRAAGVTVLASNALASAWAARAAAGGI